jgi:hypothetical protein
LAAASDGVRIMSAWSWSTGWTDVLSDHGNSRQRPTDPAALIAARWPDHCKVPQIEFKPDWTKDVKAAPFKAQRSNAGPASRRTWPTKRESSASR